MQRFVRVTELVSEKDRPPGRYPFGRSTLWRLVAAGKFPPPVRLANIPAWPVEVLEAWERAQPAYVPREDTKAAAALAVAARRTKRVAEAA